MPYEIDMMSPEDVAGEYGGDKRKIGQAVQMGILNPLVGVMAGMFIDRMRAAATQEQQPLATVAAETLPTAAPAGLGATPTGQQAASQMAAATPVTPVPAPTAVMAASGGLMDLPVPEDIVPDEYAGGGIVAFQNEGFVDPIFSAPDMGSPGPDLSKFTDEEKMQYLQGRIGYPQAAALTEGKITLDQLFKDIYGRTSTLPSDRTTRPKSAAEIKESRRPEPPKPQDRVPTQVVKDEEKAAPAAAQTDYAKMVEDLKKRFGVTDDAEVKGREALAKYREKLTSDIDKAGALSMIQAGLGIAGGKSRYALQNLAGASPAISEYAKSLEKLRGEERGLLDSEIKLDQAADARRRGDMATALKLEQDAKELAVRERQVRAAERTAGRPGAQTEYVMAYAKSKGISFDQAAKEIAEMQGEARNPLNAFIAEQIRSKGKTGQIDIREMLEKYPGVVPTR